MEADESIDDWIDTLRGDTYWETSMDAIAQATIHAITTSDNDYIGAPGRYLRLTTPSSVSRNRARQYAPADSGHCAASPTSANARIPCSPAERHLPSERENQ